MTHLTETELRNFGRSTKTFTSLDESLKSFKNEGKLFKTKIFLSHKHDEKNQLEGAISFLKSYGVNIYVDWLDEEMPKSTSGETAARIKDKINQNQKFIFLATEGAINSKWCNWELGLGDAAKYINHIAIFPIRKDYSDFKGNEYLEIYPHIVKTEYSQGIKGVYKEAGAYVVFPSRNGNNRVVPIKEWLKDE